MYFTIYQDTAGKWRWTARAFNHVIIGDSGQGYADKDDRGGPHPLDRCSSQLRWNPGS